LLLWLLQQGRSLHGLDVSTLFWIQAMLRTTFQSLLLCQNISPHLGHHSTLTSRF